MQHISGFCALRGISELENPVLFTRRGNGDWATPIAILNVLSQVMSAKLKIRFHELDDLYRNRLISLVNCSAQYAASNLTIELGLC
jgi:hypothetical protein